MGRARCMYFRLPQFLLKRIHFLKRDKWSISSVQREPFTLDVSGVGGIWVAQTPVKTDDVRNTSAAPGQLQDGGAAEAIADGCEPFLTGKPVILKNVQPGDHTRPQQGAVLFVFGGLSAGILRIVRADAFAVNI